MLYRRTKDITLNDRSREIKRIEGQHLFQMSTSIKHIKYKLKEAQDIGESATSAICVWQYTINTQNSKTQQATQEDAIK